VQACVVHAYNARTHARTRAHTHTLTYIPPLPSTHTHSALGLAVGAAAPSTESAVALGPAVMLIFIVFGGLYVSSLIVVRAGMRLS